MRGLRAGLVVTIALACAAPVAQARVLNAEAVLPPGQSGFVSVAGIADGSGSPHLYDQQSLFTDFKRKPFGLGLATGTPEVPRAGVSIVRDAYGVPSITGDTIDDAWWGAGYAVAQDRLFQLEAFRHATQGRLAELTGKGALDDDLIARRDFPDDAQLTAQFDALAPEFQSRIMAYRDGVNAWIAHVQSTPADLPGEYVATSTPLKPWTVKDTLTIGVFLARTVPSGDGRELRNLRTLQLGGPRALNALVPLSVKGQLSTIPRAQGLFPQGHTLSAKKARAALRRSAAFAKGLPDVDQQTAAARTAPSEAGRIGRVGGSSMWAVRASGGRALLFNGPQLGFSSPELFVELEVHAPGLDVRGVTAPGVPVIGTGHNANLAWGITSGLSDDDDLYAEKLNPSDHDQYMFRGQWRTMDCRNETFTYRSVVTNVIGGKAPESGTQTKRICSTVHGPVQEVVGDVAYARRYAIAGRELETLEGLAAVNSATTVRDVDAAARKLTWNENLMAADSQGNIGYWHPGLIQLRPSKWDQRLPLPGTGEAEWGGLVDRAKLPHVINPAQGWLANWNNIPSQGWTSGDGESSERITGGFHRVGYLMRLVRDLHAKPDATFADASDLVRREGTVAQQRPLATTRLTRAARGATGPAAAVLKTILAWDGDYTKVDAANTVDPGVATWEAFKTAAAARVTSTFAAAAAGFEDAPGTSHQFDITDKEALGLRTLSDAGYRLAAADAFAALAKRFGNEDPARWREPRLMYEIASQGAEQPPPLPFFDRGTWEQVVELGP